MTLIAASHISLRDWAKSGELKLEARATPAVPTQFKQANLEETDLMFGAFFGFAPELLGLDLGRLVADPTDGWQLEFNDPTHGTIFLRVKPVPREIDFSRLEARVPRGEWRDFSSKAELSCLLQIFDPCPF